MNNAHRNRESEPRERWDKTAAAAEGKDKGVPRANGRPTQRVDGGVLAPTAGFRAGDHPSGERTSVGSSRFAYFQVQRHNQVG